MLISIQPSPSTKKRRVWPALAAVVVVAGAGIGVYAASRDSEEAPQYSLTAAAASASEATNVEYEMTMTLPGVGKTTAKARLDTAADLIAMEMEFPSVGTVSAIIDMRAAMLYMEGEPFVDMGMPLSTKYVAMDLGKMPGLKEIFQANADSDPLAVAKTFEFARSTEDLGVEDVRGVEARHYRVTVGTLESVAAYPEMRKLVESMGNAMPDEVVYDVWVDGSNQLRRVKYEIVVMGQVTAADIVYTSIGNIEPIVVPDASDVTDVSDQL